MDYENKYNEALEKARIINSGKYVDIPTEETVLEYIFPELKESEDEKIRKELIDAVQGLWDNDALPMPLSVKRKDAWIAWLEKQGEKTNPYSGISFEYNGHIWGMCARDNGVDILLDKQLFKHLENQGEKPIDYNEELKKCRENPLYFIDNYVKLEEKKPAWSEEDQNILEDIEEAVINYWYGDTVDMITSWLKRRIK